MSKKSFKLAIGGAATFAIIVAASQSLAQTVTYKYDALGRLIEVHRTDESINEYAYDAAGNRTTAKSYPSSYPPPPPNTGPFEPWMVPVLFGR